MIAVRHDYSWVECGLSFGATLVLTLLAVTSLALRYITNPISCFVPAEFTDSQQDYTNQVCFQASNIFPPATVDADEEDQGPSLFTYHQWLPFFLGLAAMLCLVPHVTWRMLTTSFLWLDLHPFTAALSANQSGANRHVMLRDSALLLQAGLKGGNSVLAVATLARKALCCAVCFLQMLLMVLVFHPSLGGAGGGEEDASSGVVGYVDQVNGSLPLPLHSFRCQFDIQMLQNRNRYMVVCFLTLAQVYTKCLVFLMVIFLLLFLLCVLDLTFCAFRLLLPRLMDVTLTRYLALASQSGGRPDSSGPAHLSRFVDSLGLDGRWALAIITEQCGPLTAADLTHHLLQVFKDSPRPSPPSPSGDASAVPMVTIGDGDGNAVAEEEEKGKTC